MNFKGFTKTSISFLKDLAANNNKEWFEQNRKVYEEHLLLPLKMLSTDLGLVIRSIDTEIEISPTINKTISKIFRDTRFSNDKTPFRTGLWLTFRRPWKIWGNVPEFYFYFTPEEYQYGMGYYAATAQNMRYLREHINLNQQEFENIIGKYQNQSQFKLFGDNYKRAVPNSLPEKFQEWYQKKNIGMDCKKAIEDGFYSKNLGLILEEAYEFNTEFYHFITESINKISEK